MAKQIPFVLNARIEQVPIFQRPSSSGRAAATSAVDPQRTNSNLDVECRAYHRNIIAFSYSQDDDQISWLCFCRKRRQAAFDIVCHVN